MIEPPAMPATIGRRILLAAALGLGVGALGSCAADPQSPTSPTSPRAAGAKPSTSAPPVAVSPVMSRAQAVRDYAARPAGAFGLEVKGIQCGLPAACQGAALTFDACGGPHGEGLDAVLIEALRAQQVPATLFINQRWARANKALVRELAADPLFEIANHGSTHAPLASRGQTAYGIGGTADIAAAYDEVMDNQLYLADEFGVEARFFRSGTAHMDELGAALVRGLGLVPMNFTVNLDAGATFPASTVSAQTLGMARGSVGIGHFNRPRSGTGKGVATALPRLTSSLEAKGVRLLTLSEAFGGTGNVAPPA